MEFDQTLKQRLVGAVVITALAAIFVPMLFDDPIEDDDQSISELTIPPSPEKSFEKSVPLVQKSAEQVLEIPEPEIIKEKMMADQAGVQENSADQQAPDLGRWVIQAGSFGQKKNALELRDKLRKQGFSTYLDSITSEEGQVMYRVRVGPELDKDRAEMTRKKLEDLNKVKTFLVNE